MARQVRLRIDTYGKDAKYGPNIYKVGGRGQGARLLAAIGWVLVHSGGDYVYLRAPERQGTKRPVVEVTIPRRGDVEAVAFPVHAAGQRWQGQVCDWPARYEPERTWGSTSRTVVLGEKPEADTTHINHTPATFTVGGSDAWECVLVWRQGNDAPPEWRENTDQVI